MLYRSLSVQAWKVNTLFCEQYLEQVAVLLSAWLSKSKGTAERELHKMQQFPDHTQYRDSRFHLISARISTPTSFPMVCGLENTNVHVSWSWAAKEKSPPKRQSRVLLVPLKLFTIVQHNVTLTTISPRETSLFFHLWCHRIDKYMIWDYISEP